MNLLQEFKNFLFSQDNIPSKVTVKNYLSDINHFIKWYELFFVTKFDPKDVTPKTIEQYKQYSLSDKDLESSIEGGNHQSSIVSRKSAISERSLERHLSSFRKFFTFLKLEGKIAISPFEQVAMSADALAKADPWHIKDFKSFLYVYNASKLTIKNYIIDIKQFLNWAMEVTSRTENEVLGKIDSKLIEEYKQRLLTQGTFSPATINRKLSSLRKYTAWAGAEHLIKSLDFEAENIIQEKDEVKLNLPLAIPVFETNSEDKLITYSPFPPVRLIQKVSQAVVFVIDTGLVMHLARLIEKTQFTFWKTQGQSVFSKLKELPKSSFPVKSGSILNPRSIFDIKNIKKEMYAPLEISTASFPLYKKIWHNLKYNRPKWYKTYHSYPITHYFHFAVLIIFLSALSFGFYNAFFQSPQNQNPALAVGPTAPPRVLSFQGRLTDNNDNPITATSNLRFAIYDTLAASGSSLLWQEVDPVSPDPDGIFNVILGNNTAIPATLFAQNSALWLGVTVSVTPELTPRQQLATVAFATNAEFLQGLPPITSLLTGDAKTNTVLALDSSGNLTIGGSTNPAPVFQSTDGQFTISGKTLLLTTVAGSNTNVQISPSGVALIDLQKPLVNTTLNNNIATAKGSVEVDDLFSILATSSGQSAFTLNQNSTGPLISASASGVAKFTVDNSGNITAAGGLAISGNFLQTGSVTFGTGTGLVSINGNLATSLVPNTSLNLGSPSNNWANVYGTTYYSGATIGVTASLGCVSSTLGIVTGSGTCPSSGGTSPFTEGLGAIFANNSTEDFLFGSQASTSAKFHLFGSANLAGTQPVASIGANTSFAALVVDQKGNGDLFTASASGLPLFTITKAGNVIPGTNAGQDLGSTTRAWRNVYGTTYYSGATTGVTASLGCVSATLGIVTGSGACPGSGGGTSPFTELGGVIYPNNITSDFLIGGQSSVSAKFGILNVNQARGNQIASLSGSLTLDSSTASIQSTNNQGLTIGGNTTGNIQFKPGNSTTSMYLSSTGNVGIGTTSPLAKLHVDGDFQFGGATVNDADYYIKMSAGESSVNSGNGRNLYVTAGSSDNTAGKTGGSLYLQPGVPTSPATAYGNVIIANAGGNVGIGTTNPIAPLDVSVDNATNNGVTDLLALYHSTSGSPTAGLGTGIGFYAEDLGGSERGLGSIYMTLTNPAGGGAAQSDFHINTRNSGNGFVMTDSGAVGIGTTTPTALLDVNGAASLAGQLTFENTFGTIQTTRNQVLTLGGATTGNIVLNPANNVNGSNIVPGANNVTDLGLSGLNFRNVYATTYNSGANAGVNFTATCVTGFGGIVTSAVGCPASAPAYDLYWNQTLGALYPNNSTVDLLVGGQSTASAQFAVLNVAKNQAVASLSGNLSVFANNGWGGNIGIGTVNPTYKLDILTTTVRDLIRAQTTVSGNNRDIFKVSSNTSLSTSLFSFWDSALGSSVNNNPINFGNNGLSSNATFDFFRINPGTTQAGNILSILKGTTALMTLDASGRLGIGASTPLSTLDVRPNLTNGGTIAVASLSGKTSFAALVVDNSGVGDLFTASASGLPLFTLTQAGNVIPGTNAGQDLGSSTRTWRNVYGTTFFSGANTGINFTATCVTGFGGIVTSAVACPGGSGSSGPFQELLGAIVPNNSTEDLLIGGQATTSAIFALINVNSGTPTLKIWDSVSHNNALSLSATATDVSITSTTGTINIGQGGGTLFIQTDIQNDSSNNLGAIKISDRLNVIASDNVNTNAAAIINNAGTGDILTASAGGTARFTLTNAGGIRLGTNEGLASNCLLSGGAGVAASWNTCPGGSGSSGPFTEGLGAIFANNSTEDFLFGSQASTSAKFHLFGSANLAGTQPVASIGANTSFAALVVDQKGNGDLFTASASGLPLFTITKAGNVIPGTNAGQDLGSTTRAWRNVYGTTYYSGATTGVTASLGCVSATLGIVTGSGACPAGAPAYDLYWNQTLGALYPNNSTVDFLVGGQSTASAHFAITGNSNPNNQVNATLSGQLIVMANNGFGGNATISGALTLGAFSNGVIQTTNNQGLTIGGATTGNITLLPNNGTAGIINLNAPTINTNASTLALFNTTSTNISFAGAASTLGIGASSGTLTLNNPTIGTSVTAGTLALFNTGLTGTLNLAGAAGTINIGPGSTTATSVNLAGGSGATGCTVDGATGNLTCTGNIVSSSTTGIQGWWNVPANTGSLTPINSTLDLLIGSQATASAHFSITGLSNPNNQVTASLSGRLIIMPSMGYGGVGIGTTNNTLASQLQVSVPSTITTPTQDLVNFSNIAGQEPTVAGVNALQLSWNAKPPTSGFTAAQRININNNNVGTGGQAQALHIAARGPGTNINSDTVGLLIDSLGNASNGTTTQNAIEIGNNWDSSIYGQVDLRINAGGNIYIATSSATRVGIGYFPAFPIAQASPLATLDIRPNNSTGGTIAVASVSGQTSFAAFVVDNRGTGDIFSASESGFTIFTIKKNGQLMANAPYYINGGTGCTLKTDSTGLITCGSDNTGGGGGSSPFTEIAASGIIVANNSTEDLLLGGQSTASATFHFFGSNKLAGTQTVASIAAQTSFAAFVIDQKGTGDLFTASAAGKTLFVIKKNGFVGINNSNPQAALDIGGSTSTISNTTGNITITPAGNLTVSSGNVNLAGSIGLGGTTVDSGSNYVEAPTFLITTSGYIYASALRNLSTSNNANIELPSSGTFISRNVADSNPALYISQSHASSTGDILQLFNDAGIVFKVTQNGEVGINIGTATPLSTLDIRPNTSNGGTISVASVSGKTSFAALTVDQSGGVGDIFTASYSGATRFRIAQNGSVLMQGMTFTSIGVLKAYGTATDRTNDFAVINAQGDQGSLIPNAGFESALSALSFSDGWVVAATSTAAVTRDTTGGAKGNSSAKVTLSGSQQAAFYSTCIPITGAGSYSLSFWLKGSVNNAMAVRAYLDQYTSQANCQSDTSPTRTVPITTSTAVTTAYTVNTSGATRIATGATTTWARVDFVAGGTTSGRSVNIDGVRLIQLNAQVGTDYAEYYPANPNNIAEPGDIVSIEAGGQIAQVKPTDKELDDTVIGIVSTDPGDLIGEEVPEPRVAVALSGRVPTKVSLKNGPIHVGDILQASGIPGVAEKALKQGPSVAVADENFTNQSQIDYYYENINGAWNKVLTCDTGSPNCVGVGKITANIKLGFYDPTPMIASIENIFLNDQNTSDANFTIPHYFTLSDTLGNPLTKIDGFLELAVGNLRAGFISAKQISTNALSVTTENITINGLGIRNYIAGIVEDIIQNTNGSFVSPIASVDQIHTNLISPLSQNSDIAIKLENDKLSILNGNSASASAVSSFDNKGNATFSGQLSASSGQFQEATIGGTLHAKKIIADEIEGLNIKSSTVSANYITNVTNIYNTSNQSFPTLPASQSNNNANIFAGLFANNNFMNIATFSSSLAYVENLNAENANFNTLTAFGQTTLSDTSVVGQLSVSGNLILSSESINVLGSDLNLQPLRQGGLSIMAGLFYIDTNGNVKAQGDLTVNGNLYANVISPIPGNDLSIKLGTSSAEQGGSLRVNDKNGQSIFSLSSTGDLIASGAATFSKLNFGLIKPALAVSETEVIATGSAGVASIAAHKTEITINNPLVSDKSLIYITPTSATGNQVLFLQRQVNGRSFTVGIENQNQNPIPFNWIIVN